MERLQGNFLVGEGKHLMILWISLNDKANSSFKKSARKEGVRLEPVEAPTPSNIKDWMKD